MLAAPVGALAAAAALGLLDLIGFVTHVAYHGSTGVRLIAPDPQRLGAWSVAVPVIGGILIGAMAYWGSERIRGHGIPEAMETVLVGGSTVEPRLAVLKPISAVSIGTGGPFGAEGPIILTGGAVGSLVAQIFRFAAISDAPCSWPGRAPAWRPYSARPWRLRCSAWSCWPSSGSRAPWHPSPSRSAVAAAVAAAWPRTPRLRRTALPRACHGDVHPARGGRRGGRRHRRRSARAGAHHRRLRRRGPLQRLPVHWALWPAMGGVVVGVGGLIDPRALGVGYGTIGAELAGRLALGALAALLVTKLVIWSVGARLGDERRHPRAAAHDGRCHGGVMAPVLPGRSAGTWALSAWPPPWPGVTRSPFTRWCSPSS